MENMVGNENRKIDKSQAMDLLLLLILILLNTNLHPHNHFFLFIQSATDLVVQYLPWPY